jgi:nitric oxide reductase activation protein
MRFRRHQRADDGATMTAASQMTVTLTGTLPDDLHIENLANLNRTFFRAQKVEPPPRETVLPRLKMPVTKRGLTL